MILSHLQNSRKFDACKSACFTLLFVFFIPVLNYVIFGSRRLSTVTVSCCVTGVVPTSSAAVEEQDFIGPLSSELTHEPDYLLALSWLFVCVCAIVAVLRSTTGRRVWNTLTNHAHLHID